MKKEISTVVAGILVCAVSSGASASNSTAQSNEKEMKIFSENTVETKDKKENSISENIEIPVILGHTGQKKRHNKNGKSSWWDFLWASNDVVAKHDKNFS